MNASNIWDAQDSWDRRRRRIRQSLGEAQKAAKITRSCDYRYRKGRVTLDYREASDGTDSASRDDNFRHLRNDRIGVQVRR